MCDLCEYEWIWSYVWVWHTCESRKRTLGISTQGLPLWKQSLFIIHHQVGQASSFWPQLPGSSLLHFPTHLWGTGIRVCTMISFFKTLGSGDPRSHRQVLYPLNHLPRQAMFVLKQTMYKDLGNAVWKRKTLELLSLDFIASPREKERRVRQPGTLLPTAMEGWGE